MDAAATSGGKHDPRKQGLRSVLIYKSHMYTEASLDPKRCNHKSDQKATNLWVANHMRQLGHYGNVNSMTIYTQE